MPIGRCAAIAAAALCAAQAQPSAAQDEWEFSLTPYLWIVGVEGNVGARPGRPPVNVDAEFDSIFDKLEGGFLGKAEARRGRFGAVVDLDYLSISGGDEIRVGDRIALSGEVELSTFDATIAGYYRAHQGERVTVDLFGGARLTSVEVDVTASLNDFDFSGDVSQDWWDPIVGMRLSGPIGGRFGLTGYADYGGFGVASDAVWQVYGALDYRLTRSIAMALGYRVYGVDFEDDPLDYDIRAGGPVIAARFSF